ncbi:hypothetical protein EMGBS15_17690 [Filimonas sp.]|nr:hypothetical protein EMGBS15_17690 [Filimonas sp.]
MSIEQRKIITNRNNIGKLVFPVIVISMFLVTKWWFSLPIDGPDKIYWGFPLAFMGEGFHTSMSYQFFVFEFLVDFAMYLLFWMLLKTVIQHKFPHFILHQTFTRIIWSLTIFFLIGFGTVVSTSNPIFLLKRNYDWHVLTKGYVYIWQATPRPDITTYHPSKCRY